MTDETEWLVTLTETLRVLRAKNHPLAHKLGPIVNEMDEAVTVALMPKEDRLTPRIASVRGYMRLLEESLTSYEKHASRTADKALSDCRQLAMLLGDLRVEIAAKEAER